MCLTNVNSWQVVERRNWKQRVDEAQGGHQHAKANAGATPPSMDQYWYYTQLFIE